jgi:hypothetical protein
MLIAALIVFVAVTCIDAIVLYRTRDRHLGVNEDHFDKGVSLYETGAMLASAKPSVFRPPGYPVFVAGLLAVRDAAITIGRPVLGDVTGGRRVIVLGAHAALLGLLGAVIVWFAIGRTGTFVAAACAVGVGCNPLLLLMAGHVSYELLHLVLVAIATLMLLKSTGAGAPHDAAVFGNGLLWGVTTLVKSVTLIAPPFVLLWAALHYGLRQGARTTAFFTAGLLLMVAPYTARNYVVTDRFIPVNAQASFALWATSVERIPSGAKYLPWVETWFASGMKTFTEVTGAPDYSLAVFEDHALELGDRFSVLATDNLRRDPAVYAYNVLHNGAVFIVDQPTSWFYAKYAWPRDAGTARLVAGLSVGLMTVIGVMALVIGCVRRDPRWTLMLALFAMMWAAHAMTFLEPRYLYVKLPTMFAGFVLACVGASADGRASWRRGAVSVATLAAVLSIAGLFVL